MTTLTDESDSQSDTLHEDILGVIGDYANGAIDDDDPLGGQTPADRARDERGRFAAQAPTNGQAPEQPKPARRTGPGTPLAPEGEPAPAQAPAVQPVAGPAAAAPQYWKAEAHGDFAKLPAQAQQAIVAREAAVQKYASEAGRYRKAWEPVEQATAHMADVFKQTGQTPQAWLSDLAAVENHIYNDGISEAPTLQALEWLAQRYYGADLATLVAEQAGAAPAAPANGAAPLAIEKHPFVQQLLQRVQQVEGGLTAAQQAEQARQAAQQTERQAKLHSEFKEFSKDKPLLQAELSAPQGVERPMIAIMQRLLASQAAATFADAYEQASWIHPPAREARLKEQRTSTALRARSAAVSPRAAAPSPGATRSGTRETHEESVRAVFDELNS